MADRSRQIAHRHRLTHRASRQVREITHPNIAHHPDTPFHRRQRSVDSRAQCCLPPARGTRSFTAVTASPPPIDPSAATRRLTIRVVLAVLILGTLGWCARIGVHAWHLGKIGYALAVNAERLEQVDTALAAGSRVELRGVTVATLRSSGQLRAATGSERYDSAANTRWEALLAPIERDSARMGPRHGTRIEDIPNVDLAIAVATGPRAAVLFTAEFVPGADTARLKGAADLHAVVDSGRPVVLELQLTPRPATPVRGLLALAVPQIFVPIY